MRFGILIFCLCFPFMTKETSSDLESLSSYVDEAPLLLNSASNNPAFSTLDSAFQRFASEWNIVGMSVGIMKEGKLLYAKGFGKPELNSIIELQPYHEFRIASVSKLITATAILKLVDEDKLSLNQKVFGENGILNFPPYNSFFDQRVSNITVEHLLRHIGGWSLLTFGDPMFKPLYIADQLGVESPPKFEDIAQYVLSYRLPYTPGTRYEYSNFGYAILDRVIEQITKMEYADYIKYHVFLPNSIYSTHIGKNLFEERSEYEVAHYDFTRNNTKLSFSNPADRVSSTYGGTDVFTLGGAGGWVCSVVDLLKFVAIIDGYPSPEDILTPESLLMMINTDFPGKSPIGWRQVKDQWTWIRTGTMAGTSAIVVRQEDGFTWAILINTSTWRSRRINTYLKRMMTSLFARMHHWPEKDLFSEQ